MKFFFHPDHEPKVFDLDEPPEGWFDSPAEFGLYTAPSLDQIEEMAARANKGAPIELAEAIADSVSKQLSERAQLIAKAKELGVDIDGRWGTDRIKSAIDDYVNGNGA